MHASLLLVLPLTQEHMDRAFRIARWYGRRTRRTDLSDLESAALEGLVKAARDWDPERALRRKRAASRTRCFWSFACTRILGEMRDELRRSDHLTRDQRAMVTEAAGGVLAIEEESLSWINPHEPIPLDAAVATDGGEDTRPIVDLIEEPRDPIDNFELRDAFCRASAALPSENGSSSSSGRSRASRTSSSPRRSRSRKAALHSSKEPRSTRCVTRSAILSSTPLSPRAPKRRIRELRR